MIVKDIFSSIQGEGSLSGQYVTFVRFAGCNLACEFCDTDFSGGTEMTITEIVSAIKTEWVWLTGGEPLLQVGELNDPFIDALKSSGHKIAIETNGSIRLKNPKIDHVSLSPKVPVDKLKISYCTDLKVIYPNYNPASFTEWAKKRIVNMYVQPVWGSDMTDAIEFVKNNPEWKLSTQNHKYWGVE